MFVARNKKIWILFQLFLIAGVLFYAYNKVGGEKCNDQTKCFDKSILISVSGTEIRAQVALSDEEKSTGLSGRDRIGEDEGMLFVFGREGYWGFWMRGMKFPIDIAWIDGGKHIVHVERNVLPEGYPKSYYPPIPALYVLETRANFFAEKNIKNGDRLEF
jgi:hypothetical protein